MDVSFLILIYDTLMYIFKNDVISLNCIFGVQDSIFAWGAHQVCTYVVVSQQGCNWEKGHILNL